MTLKANRIAAVGAHAIDGIIEDDDLIGYVICVVRYREPAAGAERARVKELGFGSNLPTKAAAMEALDFVLKINRTHEPTHLEVMRTSPDTVS